MTTTIEVKASELNQGDVIRYCGSTYKIWAIQETDGQQFDEFGLGVFRADKFHQGRLISDNFVMVRHRDDIVIIEKEGEVT